MAKHDMTCIPCGLNKHSRNHYFNGKLLVERDFVDEQVYHIAKRRMLNSVLHGSGTVCGLKLKQHPSPDCQSTFIYAESGVALDCCGREIVLTKNEAIDIAKLIEQAELSITEPVDLLVGVQYVDREAEQVPVILPDCDCADMRQAANRIEECFEFVIKAKAPGSTALVRPPIEASLDWLHTINFADQRPKAVAVDNQLQQIYVAAQPNEEGGLSRIFVYRADNHDLITALNGGRNPEDLIVSPLGANLYLSDEGLASDTPFEDISGIAIYRESDIQANADPIAYIDLGEKAKLAISPTTGALFALGLRSGNLYAWSESELNTWLSSDAGNGFPDKSGPAQSHRVELPIDNINTNNFRANSILKLDVNGLFVFVANREAQGSEGVIAVNVSRMFGGDDGAVISSTLPGVDDAERVLAIQTSLADNTFVFVSTYIEDSNKTILRRFEWRRETQSFLASGIGGKVSGRGNDFAVSATEKWAYMPLAPISEDESVSEMAVVSIDEVIRVDESEPVDALSKKISVNGDAQFVSLNAAGRRLYIGAADTDPEAEPNRGLVAVLDVEEANCGEIFNAVIDGCPSCEDNADCSGAGAETGDHQEHMVVLGHLEGYMPGDRMLEPQNYSDPDSQAKIDNLSFRQVVASNHTIMEVLNCMLDEGFATGLPGPRGRTGLAGPQGEQGERGLRGQRGQQGEQGEQGERGLQGEQGEKGDRGEKGDPGGFEKTNKIRALSWVHDTSSEEFGTSNFEIAIAFEEPVLQGSIISRYQFSENNSQSCVFEAYLEVPAQLDNSGVSNTLTWTRIPMSCAPISSINIETVSFEDLGETQERPLIREYEIEQPDRQKEAQGFVLRPLDGFNVSIAGLKLKVVLKADFVFDESRELLLDGNHMLGRLSSGNQVPGGVFESWFWMGKEG
jgi:DNA-binding beta-propeller fold protein YncE